MTDQGKQKLKSMIIGLFSGIAIGAPVTAFITKRIYDKKIEEVRSETTEKAYDAGLHDMAEYSVQQKEVSTVISDAVNRVFDQDKPLTEEDYEEKDDAPDPRQHNVDIDEDQMEVTYSDIMRKYDGTSVSFPRIIDVEEFEMNNKYIKHYINWYSVDNVFEENLGAIEDPFYTFGVTDGSELFKNDARRDPNVCHIRNEKLGDDFEITRIFGAYKELVGGERPLGETNSQ